MPSNKQTSTRKSKAKARGNPLPPQSSQIAVSILNELEDVSKAWRNLEVLIKDGTTPKSLVDLDQRYPQIKEPQIFDSLLDLYKKNYASFLYPTKMYPITRDIFFKILKEMQLGYLLMNSNCWPTSFEYDKKKYEFIVDFVTSYYSWLTGFAQAFESPEFINEMDDDAEHMVSLYRQMLPGIYKMFEDYQKAVLVLHKTVTVPRLLQMIQLFQKPAYLQFQCDYNLLEQGYDIGYKRYIDSMDGIENSNHWKFIKLLIGGKLNELMDQWKREFEYNYLNQFAQSPIKKGKSVAGMVFQILSNFHSESFEEGGDSATMVGWHFNEGSQNVIAAILQNSELSIEAKASSLGSALDEVLNHCRQLRVNPDDYRVEQVAYVRDCIKSLSILESKPNFLSASIRAYTSGHLSTCEKVLSAKQRPVLITSERGLSTTVTMDTIRHMVRTIDVAVETKNTDDETKEQIGFYKKTCENQTQVIALTEKLIKETEQTLSACKQEISTVTAEIAQVETELREAKDEHDRAKEPLITHKAEIATLQSSLKAVKEKVQTAQDTNANINADLEAATATVKTLQQGLQVARDEQNQRQSLAEKMATQRTRLQVEQQAIEQTLTSTKAQTAQLTERTECLENECAGLIEARISDRAIDSEQSLLKEELLALQPQVSKAKQSYLAAKGARDKLSYYAEYKKTLAQQLTELSLDHHSYQDKVKAVSNQASQLRQEIDQASNQEMLDADKYQQNMNALTKRLQALELSNLQTAQTLPLQEYCARQPHLIIQTMVQSLLQDQFIPVQDLQVMSAAAPGIIRTSFHVFDSEMNRAFNCHKQKTLLSLMRKHDILQKMMGYDHNAKNVMNSGIVFRYMSERVSNYKGNFLTLCLLPQAIANKEAPKLEIVKTFLYRWPSKDFEVYEGGRAEFCALLSNELRQIHEEYSHWRNNIQYCKPTKTLTPAYNQGTQVLPPNDSDQNQLELSSKKEVRASSPSATPF